MPSSPTRWSRLLMPCYKTQRQSTGDTSYLDVLEFAQACYTRFFAECWR
jgi:hypothetical protein